MGQIQVDKLVMIMSRILFSLACTAIISILTKFVKIVSKKIIAFIIFSSFVLFFNCTSKSPLPLVHLTHKSPAFTLFCNVSPLQIPNVALSKRSLDFAKSRLLFLLQR